MHGGLECGVQSLRTGNGYVTMGPKMEDIHTPQERLDWKALIAPIALRAFITKLNAKRL